MSQEYIVSVFLHIVLASFWIGGMLFLPLVLLPNIKNHPDRVKLLYATGVRFRYVGWISLILLLVTGTSNYLTRGLPIEIEFLIQSDYGKLLLVKLILFIAMLISGAIHDWYIGKKALDYQNGLSDPKMRKLAQWSGRINLILALAIAYIGVALSRGWY
jgi:copper resistance protein D